jgi:arginyl-tRNA--protein-N-Asp/Glu arginylyltransferase
VDDCRHLRYKGHYFPHQRKVDGSWVSFETPPPATGDKSPAP